MKQLNEKTAKDLLSIDETRFSRIPTIDLKKQHLTYLLLSAEIETIANNDFTKFQNLQLAYQSLLGSRLMTEQTTYRPFSKGLHEFDIRSIYRAPPPLANSSLDDSNTLFQSLTWHGEKTSGVEPGFEALQKSDILFEIFKRYPEPEARWQFIHEFEANLFRICEHYKEDLPKYLIKMDYREISNGVVFPQAGDLKRSKTIGDIYKMSTIIGDLATLLYSETKIRNFIDINKDAVREVLGNDLVRVYGVPTQDQHLFRGEYQDGRLQLMLKAEWLKGAKILGPVFGSPNNKSYCANKVLLSQETIKHLFDNQIKNLPESLPAMLVLGDPDGIGSSAQNKLNLNNSFVCIDTGHAFETNMIKEVSKRFTVNAKKAKNFTVFSAPISEILRGLIKIAKVAGYNIAENILKSYGSDFALTVTNMAVGSDKKIFADYIAKFTEISEEFLPAEKDKTKNDNLTCCHEIIKDIITTRDTAITTRNELIQKFEQYFNIKKEAVDLIENLDRLLAGKENTTLRSPDCTVMLHHLRIIDENKIKWSVEIPADQKGGCQFNFSFETQGDANKAWQKIADWLKKAGRISDNLTNSMKLETEAKSIVFCFDYALLSELNKVFSEEKIKEFFHPEDYQLLLLYQSELELIAMQDRFSSEEKITMHIAPDDNKKEYQISFSCQENIVPPKLLSLIQKHFNNENGQIIVKANDYDVKAACQLLNTILFEYNKEQIIEDEMQKINQLVISLQEYQRDFKVQIQVSANALTVSFDAPLYDAIVSDILQANPCGDLADNISYLKLATLKEKLQQYIMEYQKIKDEMQINLKAIDDYNRTAKQELKLHDNPITMSELKNGKFKLSLSHSSPSEFILLAQQQLTNFEQDTDDKKIYWIVYNQLAELNQLLRIVSSQYLEAVSKQAEEFLVAKSAEINQLLREFKLNLKSELCYSRGKPVCRLDTMEWDPLLHLLLDDPEFFDKDADGYFSLENMTKVKDALNGISQKLQKIKQEEVLENACRQTLEDLAAHLKSLLIKSSTQSFLNESAVEFRSQNFSLNDSADPDINFLKVLDAFLADRSNNNLEQLPRFLPLLQTRSQQLEQVSNQDEQKRLLTDAVNLAEIIIAGESNPERQMNCNQNY